MIYKENHGFNEEYKPWQKVVTAVEELDNIDINDIGNSRIYLQLCSSMKNGEILSHSTDGGELTRNISQK